MREVQSRYGIPLSMKLLLTIGLLMWLTACLSGCSAFGHQMCEDQLADTRAQLARTAALANNLSAELQEQQAEIEVVKQFSAENVRREKEKELARIEAQRKDLERERFEIDQMRELEEARRGDQNAVGDQDAVRDEETLGN
jgi:hypothetical protein